MHAGRRLPVPLLFALGLAAAAAARRGAVRAGDYHEGATLACAECHVIHTLGAGTAGPARDEVGPLLRADVDDLCLSCHDDSSRAADVLGRNLGRHPADVRQAGHLNRLGVEGDPATGHTLGSTDTAPGSSPPWSAADGLSCTDCHAPHGSGEHAYRNLRSDAGHNAPGEGLVTYNHASPGTNDLGRDVFVRAALGYDESEVDFNEPDRRDSAMARFCAGCHGLFHGLPGDALTVGGALGPDGRYRGFLRHPSGGVDLAAGSKAEPSSSLGRFERHVNKVKVMSPTGQWSSPAGATPTCISCHKAHGNDNAFGLIFRSGRGALSEEGDAGGTGVEHLCGQCHGEPSPFAGA